MSYERHVNRQYPDYGPTGRVSKVWFSIAEAADHAGLEAVEKRRAVRHRNQRQILVDNQAGSRISRQRRSDQADVSKRRHQRLHGDAALGRMERWEEQEGYSPSTEATIITGLLAAADIARHAGDPGAAAWYEQQADRFKSRLASALFTTSGTFNGGQNNGRYYLSITKNENPNDGEPIDGGNGKPALSEKEVLDAGFLELVRYGVLPANDPQILDSLDELDDTGLPDNLRVKYLFASDGPSPFPGWRRYGNDGYGERTDNGGNYEGGNTAQRGRVWPISTGERGHFELERIKAANNGQITPSQVEELKAVYVCGMERFANEGLMLPEQVFDGVGDNSTHHFATGEGTDSATPLAWSHAEYIKLVKSLADRAIWDFYPVARRP